jgi:DNA-binding LacI/PurR family transcriptional regulator
MNSAPGKKNVTIKDLAIASGVSIATVSRVLNNIQGCCSAETEARIRQVAEEMGYAPNVMARSLVTRKTGLVAVLIPDIHYYFYQEFYFGLEDYFNRHGIRPILCTTLQSQEKEKEYIQQMSNGLVDGMIISTLNSAENNEEILKLREKKFPLVLLERYGRDLESCCSVRVDNSKASEIAVDYLCRMGHRRIAFIGGPEASYNSMLRYQGYLNGLRKNGIEVDSRLIACADYQFEKSVVETRKLAEEQEFTALVAANDLMCVGACTALVKMKKKIPQDVSVVGLDNTAYLELYQPAITAVSFHALEMGKCAARCIKEQIDGKGNKKKDYSFTPTIKIGKSIRNLN